MTPNNLRQIFRFLNRYFMVPIFRLGLGIFLVNPLSGYIMVLKTKGRKSGMTRYAPVNYAIANGVIYCISGFGQVSDWYRNLMAQPDIDVILPSGAVHGHATVVSDALERNQVVRQVLINAGFAGYMEGYDPRAISDDELERRSTTLQVIRITPNGLAAGAFDPGGWSWILWTVLFVPMIIWWIIKKR
jgi:deazaflavin-dependent oxidoreductase (nitroreductase family)